MANNVKKFWEARASIGRPRIFETPEDLYNSACEYFDYTTNRTDLNAYGFKQKRNVPFTLTGLCIFLGVNTKYFWDFKRSLNLEDPKDLEFSEVVNKIEEIIQTQQVTGAIVGLYKENIIARLNGIKDSVKQEVTETKAPKVEFFDPDDQEDDGE